MAVFSMHTWRPKDGRMLDFMAAVVEAKGLLEKHGGIVGAWQPVAGGLAGTVTVVITYADAVAYGRAQDALRQDADFQAFWARAAADPSAAMVENLLASDLDAAESLPEPGSTLIFTTTFHTLPGKTIAHRAASAEARGHLERLGGKVRQLQAIGGPPNSITTIIGFEDFGHYAEFTAKLAVDEGFTNFMLGLENDPPAEQLNTGLAALLPLE